MQQKKTLNEAYDCDSFVRKKVFNFTIPLFDSELDRNNPDVLVNLVQLMTRPFYTDRITAEQALDHAWFKLGQPVLPLQTTTPSPSPQVQKKSGGIFSWLGLGLRFGGKTFKKRKNKPKSKNNKIKRGQKSKRRYRY
jgi:hypothetical protein